MTTIKQKEALDITIDEQAHLHLSYVISQDGFHGKELIDVESEFLPDLIKALVKGLNIDDLQELNQYIPDYLQYRRISLCEHHIGKILTHCQICWNSIKEIDRLTKQFGDTE
jgi:hypothetical protein